MILYDLLHKDPTEVQPKQEEEEIDITQEAQQFKPVEVSKEMSYVQKPVTAEEKPTADTSKKTDTANSDQQRQADSTAPAMPKKTERGKTAVVNGEKFIVPDSNPSELSDDNSATPVVHPLKQQPSTLQQSEPQSPQETKEDAKKADDEDIYNETEYSGAKKFEDLEQEIIACSQEDPEMQAAAYEIMRIDREQA